MNTVTKTGRRANPASARIRVSEAMHEGVLTCSKDASLAYVAAVMAGRRVHCIVVAGDGRDPDDLWGLVSDLDLVAAASVRDLDEQTAGAAAATTPLTVRRDETIQRAAQLMTEHGATHLVVVDDEGRPGGVLSTLDVAAVLAAP